MAVHQVAFLRGQTFHGHNTVLRVDVCFASQAPWVALSFAVTVQAFDECFAANMIWSAHSDRDDSKLSCNDSQCETRWTWVI